jgi:plasmid replication initiation protein
MDKLDIQRKREFTIRKANEIIQKAHSEMSAQQLDILAYMVSMIKPEDKPEQMYQFSVKEFCEVCNKNYRSGYYYQSVKNDIQAIASVNVWVLQDNGKERLVHWLDDAVIDKGNGLIEISFHKSIYPYLFDLQNRLTFYPREYYIALKGEYAKKLYELLKSIENLDGVKTLKLDYIKWVLGATNYDRYPDFRRFVLEKAVEEINKFTDLEVLYTPKKINSRAITHIGFNIRPAENDTIRKTNREFRLDKETIDYWRKWEEENQKALAEMEQENPDGENRRFQPF